jgi:hypothetical protein
MGFLKNIMESYLIGHRRCIPSLTREATMATVTFRLPSGTPSHRSINRYETIERNRTDKKENAIFLKTGAVAKSYTTNGLLTYD